MKKNTMIGHHFSDFIHPDDLSAVKKSFKSTLTGDINPTEFRVVFKNGRTSWVRSSSSPRVVNKKVVGIAGILADISEQKNAEENLERSEERYRNLVEQSPISIVIYDKNGLLVSSNPAGIELYGVSSVDDIKGLSLFENPNISDENKAKLRKQEIVSYEVMYDFDKIKASKRYKTHRIGIAWLKASIAPTYDDDKVLSGYLLQAEDITARIKLEEKLKDMSLHDALTGLYSRYYFEEQVKKLEKSRHHPIGVINIDIDDLKLVNDGKGGHEAGDRLIKSLAVVLKKVFRSDDCVARVGGDEFVILLTNADDKAVSMLVDRLQEAIKQSNLINTEFTLSISIGTAAANVKDTLQHALKLADQRMYAHKKKKAQ